MKVWYQDGIHLKIDGIHLVLDPVKKTDLEVKAVLVSHGHADHASGLKEMKGETIVMHPATYSYKKDAMDLYNNDFIMITEGDKIDLLGLTVEAFRAGHCLGSLQFKITGKEGSIIFTGDISVRGTHTEAGAPILQSDNLIIEANFGDPKYVFPKRNEILARLSEWILARMNNRPIILFAHGLGKTQELTLFLNDIGVLKNDTSRLFMNGNAYKSNIVFQKYRYRFQSGFQEFSRSSVLEAGDFLIHPMYEKATPMALMEAKSKLNAPHAAVAHVSGWALENTLDYTFPLSSHSGFNELIEYVKKSTAKKVYTFHGSSETLARQIRKLGIESQHLTPNNEYS